MIITAHHIRKAIFDALNGNVTYSGSVVPVFNKVPHNTTYPFIKIYGDSEKSVNLNQSDFINEVVTKIEVVTRFKGNAGGELQAQLISTLILDIIKPNAGTAFTGLHSGLNNFVCRLENIVYLEDYTKDNTYYRAIISFITDTQKT